MAKPRRQTYTLQMYLKKINEMDIRSDQDVQRMSGAWNNGMVNELIASVLNDEYIPPIILGQEKNSQAWVIDGLQRSTALMMFRYGNYRVTSSVEEPAIAYRAKVRGTDGEVQIDGNGDVVWEGREFDLRGKTYGKLPEELQKKFNEYQIETVIHEGYSMGEISKLVRRYNNHKAMNVSQRAFTFVDRYARKIRGILKRRFFIECTGYTKSERRNGTLERIIMESVMCMFHMESWKKPGQIGAYINENAAMGEFETLDGEIARLEGIVTGDLYSVFTSRDSFILFTLFHKFTSLGLGDSKFAGFLAYLKETMENTDMDEFYGIDKNSSTKDKGVITKKLGKLWELMCQYLGMPGTQPEPVIDAGEILKFVRENVSPHATAGDTEQYTEVLEALMAKAGCGGKLLETANRPSMVAVVAYSFENDIDLDGWAADYAGRHGDYIPDQKENYAHMVQDLERYIGDPDAA